MAFHVNCHHNSIQKDQIANLCTFISHKKRNSNPNIPLLVHFVTGTQPTYRYIPRLIGSVSIGLPSVVKSIVFNKKTHIHPGL